MYIEMVQDHDLQEDSRPAAPDFSVRTPFLFPFPPFTPFRSQAAHPNHGAKAAFSPLDKSAYPLYSPLSIGLTTATARSDTGRRTWSLRTWSCSPTNRPFRKRTRASSTRTVTLTLLYRMAATRGEARLPSWPRGRALIRRWGYRRAFRRRLRPLLLCRTVHLHNALPPLFTPFPTPFYRTHLPHSSYLP